MKIFYLSKTQRVKSYTFTWGNVRQSVDFYEKNLPKFKKVFGEKNGDFLDMMECFRDDYLSLGRYDDAYADYKDLVQAYKARRIAASYMDSAISDIEDRVRFFANVVPVYKNASAVAADIEDADFAFYCSDSTWRKIARQFRTTLALSSL